MNTTRTKAGCDQDMRSNSRYYTPRVLGLITAWWLSFLVMVSVADSREDTAAWQFAASVLGVLALGILLTWKRSAAAGVFFLALACIAAAIVVIFFAPDSQAPLIDLTLCCAPQLLTGAMFLAWRDYSPG